MTDPKDPETRINDLPQPEVELSPEQADAAQGGFTLDEQIVRFGSQARRAPDFTIHFPD